MCGRARVVQRRMRTVAAIAFRPDPRHRRDVLYAQAWTIVISDEWHKGSGGLLVVSFLTSVAIGMALELGQLLLNHVCCKCCPCHDDEAISDAPAGQRADVVVAQPAAQA